MYPGVILRDLKPVEATAPTIVSVGRMDPFKGFDELLKAAAQLRAEGVELDVRLAGPQDRVHTETQRELKRWPTSSGSAARRSAGPTTSTRSTRAPASSRSRASPRARTAPRARARRSC